MTVLDGARAVLEQNTLGFDYADVSAELARIWNFPDELTAALSEIPDPLLSKTFNHTAGWVHLGAWRARAELLGMSDEDIVASYPAQLAKRLNINPAWVPELVAQSPEQTAFAMPPLTELTAGLDAMFD